MSCQHCVVDDAPKLLSARMIREWALIFIIALAIAFSVQWLLVRPYEIPSLSMAPTLDDGDRVLVNRLSYRLGDIERGQVVVFDRPPNLPGDTDSLIKRVVGLPGETVVMRDGHVYVDGLLVVEPYTAQQNQTWTQRRIPGCADARAVTDTCTIPDGHVFVLGDNRAGSDDSRTFGPIPDSTIVGRAFVRVWPLSDVDQL